MSELGKSNIKIGSGDISPSIIDLREQRQKEKDAAKDERAAQREARRNAAEEAKAKEKAAEEARAKEELVEAAKKERKEKAGFYSAIRSGIEELIPQNLAEISTIDWRLRHGGEAPWQRNIKSKNRIEKNYIFKDIDQGKRLEELRGPNPSFDIVQEWYFSLGSDPDLFNVSRGKKFENGEWMDTNYIDSTQSEAIRAYLLKSATVVIKQIEQDELRGSPLEFKIARNIESDKRILAANMLTEAAEIAFKNNKPLEEIDKLLETSRKLLWKAKQGNSKYSEEANLYWADAVNMQSFYHYTREGSRPEDKQLDLDDIKRAYRGTLKNSLDKEEIGDASEALCGLLFNEMILDRASDIAICRKAFLREDMPHDDYAKYSPQLPKAARDMILKIYDFDDDKIISEDVYLFQIKTRRNDEQYRQDIGVIYTMPNGGRSDDPEGIFMNALNGTNKMAANTAIRQFLNLQFFNAAIGRQIRTRLGF